MATVLKYKHLCPDGHRHNCRTITDKTGYFKHYIYCGDRIFLVALTLDDGQVITGDEDDLFTLIKLKEEAGKVG